MVEARARFGYCAPRAGLRRLRAACSDGGEMAQPQSPVPATSDGSSLNNSMDDASMLTSQFKA
ncbi:MAG: hypothetical protein KKC79_16305 [Gammaproteobacteria bacterium]|nr:hypothetical protein [Gammaproteobacteria bacterium]MBU1440526.1 hypothetical protein [Gammaproteobacteria bacterium]MBU2285129.1 hypothetical protein [Gammaproteobacteria bacterium]MBU2410198.1 hypothetical protein [Gammaproteobacteria bacterium]